MIRILAVDDLESNLLALQAALDDPGYELRCVQSGLDAIVAAAEEDFALILLDVQMPGMDGFETAKRLRNHPRSRHTPIIFLTAIHRDDHFVEKGYFEGAVDYLFKPLNTNILRSKVAVFVDLFRKTQEIARQAEREKEHALRELENRMLKNAVDVRDEFLSVTSHELKTPLTPLLLQIQRFRELIEDGQIRTLPNDKLLKMSGITLAQVRRLSRLVDDLLDLTRIIEGKLSLQPSEFGLSELVKRILDEFEHEIAKAGCRLALTLETAQESEGYWDLPRLEQVVINLLVNALKYGGGKEISVRVSSDSGDTVLEFTDQGIGISREDQARIFERFERAVSNGHYAGLGLGLFISKNIVDAHRGEISVESDLGKGSTFRVRLPKRALSEGRPSPLGV